MVVIDVLRSFTTAAYAFAAGARRIYPVATPDKALELRAELPGALAMGAFGGGWPIPGFDLDNAPSRIAGHDLCGKTLIQCTAAGVRGLLRCPQAEPLLAGSLVCARATVQYLRRRRPARVTLVVTGDWSDRDGDEDRACAEYLAALLRGGTPDPAPFAARVASSDFGRRFVEPDHPALPAADVACAAAVDSLDFAMLVRRADGLLVLEPVDPLAVDL